MVSAPALPSIVSFPAKPVRELTAAFPVRVLARVLPVPLIAAPPVSVRFSTLPGRVYVTDDSMRSVPALDASVTTVVLLETTYLSSPESPTNVLEALLDVKIFATLLPVAVKILLPVMVIFSTLSGSV